MKKEKYSKPMIAQISFNQTEIITASGTYEDGNSDHVSPGSDSWNGPAVDV